MLKLIFCGARDWPYLDPILTVMSRLKDNLGPFVIIEGEAAGADTLSKLAAKKLGLEWEECPAKWKLHGKAAGPIRNTQMRVEGKANGVVAFHPDLSKSKGTKNMVEQSLNAGLPVWTSEMSDEQLMQFILQLRRKVNGL